MDTNLSSVWKLCVEKQRLTVWQNTVKKVPNDNNKQQQMDMWYIVVKYARMMI